MPVVVIIVIIIGIIAAVLLLRQTTWRPRVTDHWHARYQVVVCGEPQPSISFETSPELGVHTHGDGLIHIHPNSTDDEGKNANLGRFLARSGADAGGRKVNEGLTFERGLLRLPDGREFRDGNPCPDGQPGEVRLLVGRTPNIGSPELCTDYKENDKFGRYAPREGGSANRLDGDCIRMEFGPPGATPAPGTPSPTPGAAATSSPTASPAPSPAPTPAR